VNTPEDRRTTMNPGVGWRPGMNPASAADPSPVHPGRSPGEKPVIRLNVTPMSATSPSRDLPPEGSAGADAWAANAGMPGNAVRIPVNALYLAIAALVALIILAFAVGSVLSRRHAERELASQRPQPIVTEPPELITPSETVGQPTEPIKGDVSKNEGEQAAKEKARTPDAGAKRVQTTAAPAGGPCLTSRGWEQEDPREGGLNYLLLAYLTQTESEDAVTFLSQNGLETFALRVDPQQVRGNNSGPTRPYKLYVSKGITSDEYSKKMTAKTNVEAAVARLGPRWQKERKGSSNFGKPAWEKK
jgi:hypothetical protein